MGFLSPDTPVELLMVSSSGSELPGSLTSTLHGLSILKRLHSNSHELAHHFLGNPVSLSLAPRCFLAMRGEELCSMSSGTPVPTCQASSPLYTNSRIYHLFGITWQCLAPFFLQ